MKSCGLVVEYNPFHYGHRYHVQEAKKVSNSDVMIAVMSGNFLQRGEPAIIDKFHRAKAALSSGVDLVLELPYAYAVQHSDYFAEGAIKTLQAIGVSSICFGSESGEASDFIHAYHQFLHHQKIYETELKARLKEGLPYPKASMHAYQKIGLTNQAFDLSKPNNILGLAYVKTVLANDFPIEIHTIKRFKNEFHEPEIAHSIASATSIRKEILNKDRFTEKASATMPPSTKEQLQKYKREAQLWHDWEKYFKLVNYRVQTMLDAELEKIHGISEGLEYRIKQTAKQAVSMNEWIGFVKSKRYTWTRIQRVFTHVLTNTKKAEVEPFLESLYPPYIRILGMTKKGQAYLNQIKKQVDLPFVHQFTKNMHPMLKVEEKATAAYYSILPVRQRQRLAKQELKGPIRI